jgi:hypothetical protein
MAKVVTNRIRLGASLEDAQDKLQQQIKEGEVIRNRGGVLPWMDVEELKAERRLWAEYTAEVLKALFESNDYARDFDLETTPVSRSGSIQDFAFDERTAILAGVTFLRSLHKRLPLIAAGAQRPRLQPPSRQPSEDNPQGRATADLLVTRLSYRGTANELREILREVLARLAPDDQVVSQP